MYLWMSADVRQTLLDCAYLPIQSEDLAKTTPRLFGPRARILKPTWPITKQKNWLPEVAFNPDLAPRSRLILSPFSFSYLTLRCLYKICLLLTWKIRNCFLDYWCRLFKDFCQPHPQARSAVRVSAGGLATNAMARSFQANSLDTLNRWLHIRTRQGQLGTRLLFCVRLPYAA